MPITLKPTSRRQFILGGALATAAYLFKFPFNASAVSADRNYWALFSDTHIAANRAEIHKDVNMSSHLESAIREVLSDKKNLPTGLLVNGDCAFQNGEEADYRAFVESLGPIREASIPIHLTLGNHDHREHFGNILKQKKEIGRDVPDHLVACLKSPFANWFLLDSLDKTLSAPGFLGSPQLEWLSKSLDSKKHTPAIVVVHHNPVFSNGKNTGLLDTAQLMKILRPRRNVKALIFGHTHTWKTSKDESGLHLINLPPVAYPFEQGQPSGWVRARLQKDSAELELRSLDTSHPAHGQKVRLEWRT